MQHAPFKKIFVYMYLYLLYTQKSIMYKRRVSLALEEYGQPEYIQSTTQNE